MSARSEVLGRIRAALTDAHSPAPVVRDYRPATGAGDVDLFAERVADYRATVHRWSQAAAGGGGDAAADGDDRADDLAGAIDGVLRRRAIARVVVPDGFPTDWRPGVETVDEPVDVATLDGVGAVLTTCAVAVAETGTIVLDAGPGMGPRALTLVPDYHLVVVRADQIVANVPDAVAALDPTRPLTWISGPSATSDIELNRVEGVHGPRTLDVLISG